MRPVDRTAGPDLRRVVGAAHQHDSAIRHVNGSASYVDDLREPAGTLHLAVGGAPVARGRIKGIDLAAVRAAPGVVIVLTAADIPGKNDVSPVKGDDPMFAESRVEFHGQVIFAVVARSRDAARRAARLARIEIEPEPPLVTVDQALAAACHMLERSSRYRERRQVVSAFNATSPIIKRGLALTPVKFGISFTTGHLNQAGALVHVYQDGSVHLNHGGTEMGQGLLVKVAQVVAEEFGIDLDRVTITATTTAQVPNTSATAASSGSDLNGMAARAAAAAIKRRLVAFAAELFDVDPSTVEFRDNRVVTGNHAMGFSELVKRAYLARISLSSTGFYRTPKIHWNAEKACGRPFYYFAYGAACAEVAIDTLTGEMKVTRVDILHDVGRSLNPAIDIGQIEGGFVQGMGWLTSEELIFDDGGRLLTHAPSTYKIPCASDLPVDFRVTLFEGVNREETIYRSKAVGEPPLMLAIAVFAAVADAIHSLAPGRMVPLDAPATPESILHAIQAVTNGEIQL
jgi:xanthine dehydrogenase molybdopterin-binding subunit B